MAREQILLGPGEAKWLRDEAFTTRKSKSEIVRNLIKKEQERRRKQFVDKHTVHTTGSTSGRSDNSRE